MKKSRRYIVIVYATLLIAVTMLCAKGVLVSLEERFSDSLLKSGASYTDDVMIIAIDDYSINAIGRYPWDRDIHAALIRTVSQGNPAAIGLDLLFTEPSEQDDLLQDAIRDSGVVILAGSADLSSEHTFVKRGGPLHGPVIKQLDELSHAAAGTGMINGLVSGWDSKMRRHIPYIENIDTGELHESFSIALYNRMNESLKIETVRTIPTDYVHRPYIRYAGPPGTISSVSFYDALDADVIDPEYYRDKILLVGFYATGTDDDTYFTPASGVRPMYGVEIHANIINNLIFSEEIYPAERWVSTAICFILGFLSLILLLKYPKMLKKSICTIVVLLLYLAIYYISFLNHYILAIVYPILLLLAIYISEFIFAYVSEYAEKKRITKAFGRYVAPQVLEKIMAEGEESLSLGGVKKEISVLFVDIRGFTKMSELMEPEAVVAVLNEYLLLVTQAVFNNQGTLDKYIGDGVMAIYNVPFDLENHSYYAVKTAIEIKQASSKLYDDLQKKYGVSVAFGIGINTGDAVVGNIGSKVRMDYTAIGDAVNVAARLESNAKPGQILISKAIFEKVSDQINAQSVGAIHVKNRDAAIDVYEVIDENKMA